MREVSAFKLCEKRRLIDSHVVNFSFFILCLFLFVLTPIELSSFLLLFFDTVCGSAVIKELLVV